MGSSCIYKEAPSLMLLFPIVQYTYTYICGVWGVCVCVQV